MFSEFQGKFARSSALASYASPIRRPFIALALFAECAIGLRLPQKTQVHSGPGPSMMVTCMSEKRNLYSFQEGFGTAFFMGNSNIRMIPY